MKKDDFFKKYFGFVVKLNTVGDILLYYPTNYDF